MNPDKLSIHLYLLLLFVIVISGCILIEPKIPYISEVKLDSPSGFVQEGERFTIFFTIKNNYNALYNPYISVNYDDDLITFTSPSAGERIDRIRIYEFASISPQSEKNYNLDFTLRDNPPSNTPIPPRTDITIWLFGSLNITNILDSKTITIKIA